MQNNLSDLNNILFVQLERLQDDEVCHDKESTEAEIKKTEAINKIAGQVISIGQVQLKSIELGCTYNIQKKEFPELIENKRAEKWEEKSTQKKL